MVRCDAQGLMVLSVLLVMSCASDGLQPAPARRQATTALEPEPLRARVVTPPLHQDEGAPRTPDGDDPAIWVGAEGKTLVLAALKDAGLAV